MVETSPLCAASWRGAAKLFPTVCHATAAAMMAFKNFIVRFTINMVRVFDTVFPVSETRAKERRQSRPLSQQPNLCYHLRHASAAGSQH
jgi:hypothetical protein